MNSNDASERWARLRFAVVGPLLASPAPAGQLRAELERLAEREWEHPSGKGPVRFAVSTIERWYYQARAADNDPVGALKRRPRADAGRVRAMSPALIEALRAQYRAHPSWSAQLHHENLAALVASAPELGPMPSYATLTRAMRARGLVRKRRRKWHESEAGPAVEAREVLSYEVSRSHALWHADMHHAKRRVLTASGEWKTPVLLGFLDDHSRLGCHLQWYLAETAEVFVHGLSQAFMKRGLPRSLLVEYVPWHIFDEQSHREPPARDGLFEHGQERGGVLRVGEGGEGNHPGGVVDERNEEGLSAPAPVGDLRSVHDIAHPKLPGVAVREASPVGGGGVAGARVEQSLAREQPVYGRGGERVVDAAFAGGFDEGFDRQCGLLGLERDEYFGGLGRQAPGQAAV